MNSADIMFFFGAGASAPFGIPTMKQMVIDFENELSRNGTKEEREIYSDIKKTLEAIIGKNVDLEAVFTVIDGIINYDVERLGLLSTYASAVSFAKFLTDVPPPEDMKNICKGLRTKFQNFVREKCLIPEESFSKISVVYHDFFNRFIVESDTRGGESRRSDYWWRNTWTIFTTNYDTCLEYYWRQVARAPINTGFSVDEARRTWVLNPSKFYEETRLRLLKLHGSIGWEIEPDGIVTEEQTVLGRSLVGREFVGEMMIYPVQEKELYLDPYISMFVQLNRELKNRSIWVIIGYSFNDPVIREIFLKNSNERKKIILVHPDAFQISTNRLNGLEGDVGLITEKFGLEHDFRFINHSIITKLKPNPRYSYDETPA